MLPAAWGMAVMAWEDRPQRPHGSQVSGIVLSGAGCLGMAGLSLEADCAGSGRHRPGSKRVGEREIEGCLERSSVCPCGVFR